MKRRFGVAACATLAAAFAAAPPRAQQLTLPHAAYVYPAGGRQGSTLQAIIGGQFLDGAARVLVSGSGVTAHVVRVDKPMTGREMADARERLQQLQNNARDPAVQKEIAALRERIGDATRRLSNPSLSELLTLEISIAGDAEPDLRELRVATATGLTEPLVFSVGQLPEFRERDLKHGKEDAELEITLPAVVNGRIIPGDTDRARFPLRQLPQYMPGDVDRYRFTARKGQHLVVAVSARELMPYLADTVPGWFQAVVALLDCNGREIAYDDDYRFHPDPVLQFDVPADGEYVVEINDALYRGREDFVYRISIGELPFVTSAFPLGGRTGTRTRVALTGWNLPHSAVMMDGRGKSPGVYPVVVDGRAARSNVMPFALDDLPEISEREPNESAARGQRVTLPVVVNGRIERPGDVDVFTFGGRAGDRIVAEVFARRLESPLDSALELLDARGQRIAFNDDHEDKAAWWLTHHADSQLTATLPARGEYRLRIRDVQQKGGPDYAYRLRIAPPRPDFTLLAAPSALTIAGTTPITVHALRRDGFSGDIALSLRDAPDGFVLSGGVIPSGQDRVRVTLTAPRVVVEPVPIRVEGRAVIEGRTIVRGAAPVDDRMQAFANHHLVPAQGSAMLVTSRGGRASTVLARQPISIPSGGTTEVRVALPPGFRTFENLTFDLSDPPEGLGIAAPSIDASGVRFLVKADAAKAVPGLRGTLIVLVSGERVTPGTPAVRRRVALGTLPAISFEIAPH